MLLQVIHCAGVENRSQLVQKWLVGRFFTELLSLCQTVYGPGLYNQYEIMGKLSLEIMGKLSLSAHTLRLTPYPGV